VELPALERAGLQYSYRVVYVSNKKKIITREISQIKQKEHARKRVKGMRRRLYWENMVAFENRDCQAF